MKQREAAAGPVPDAETATAAPAPAAPGRAESPAEIIALQRSAGNAAVGRLLAAQLARQPAPPVAQPAPMTLGAAQAQIVAATAQQIEEAAAAVNEHRAQDPISIPMPTGTISLPRAEALQLYETAVQHRMVMFYDWRRSVLATVPPDVAASQGVTPAAVAGSIQVTPAPAAAPTAPAQAGPPPPGPGGVPQAELDRYAAQRALAQRLRTGADAGLQALRRITRGRPDRWSHPRPEVVEAILAAIQLEAVGLAEADVAAGGDPHSAAVASVGGDANANWCGYYAQYGYRVAEEPRALRQALFHVTNVENLFTYVNDTRTPAAMIVGGRAESLRAIHAGRNAPRRWWDAATLRSTAADQLPLRPGDIVLVDNAGKPGPNHIQTVRSWDPATRMLFTIDGNGGGYVVDNSPGAATAAPGSPKEARVEASTGLRLRGGPEGGHAGVGAADLGSQPDPAAVEAAWQRDQASPPWQEYNRAHQAWVAGGRVGEEPTAPPTPLTDAARRQGGAINSRVYGIGRFSIMDFEEHDYTTAPVGTTPAPGRR